jgi:hypothetical protein
VETAERAKEIVAAPIKVDSVVADKLAIADENDKIY